MVHLSISCIFEILFALRQDFNFSKAKRCLNDKGTVQNKKDQPLSPKRPCSRALPAPVVGAGGQKDASRSSQALLMWL